MKQIMEEYTEIVNDYILMKNGKFLCEDAKDLFNELDTFWLCEYDNLMNKLQKQSDELRTYHFSKTSNDVQNIIERSSLFADKIIIPDMSVLMGAGLNPSNYQMSYETALGFLSVVYELTDWINEGIVVVIPNRLNGSLNYSMDSSQIESLMSHFKIQEGHTAPTIESAKMFTANDVLNSSSSYRAIPSTNHSEMWEHIVKILKDDEKKIGSDMVNITSMNSLNLNFLNNVPLDFAKEIRDKGYLAELRKYFKTKFKDIETLPFDSDFANKVNDISIDIKDEISIHEHEWDEIKRELLDTLAIKVSAGVMMGTATTLVSGGMSFASLLGLIGGSIPAGSGITDIINYINKRRDLKMNGIHLLFELNK